MGARLAAVSQPRAMLKPVLWLALPVLGLLAGITFVANPRALALADEMVQDANRSLLVAGLEAGRFVDLPGRMGVIYIGSMTPDGRRFTRLFVQSENDGRLDIITAACTAGSRSPAPRRPGRCR